MHIIKKINSFMEYIILFLMLISEITVIGVIPKADRIVKGLFCFFLFFYTICNAIKLMQHKKYFERTMLIFVGVEIYNFIFLFMNKTNQKSYIIYFVFILGCFIFVTAKYVLDNNYFYKMLIKLSNIIFIITVLSLILYILGSITNIISPTSVKALYWNVDIQGIKYVNSYFDLLYQTQNTILGGISIPRNSSIYTEATLYCIFLNVAFGVDLFIREKLNKVRIFILIIATFTTFSTTGIVIMIATIITKMIIYNPLRKSMKIMKLVTIPIIVCFLGLVSILIINSKIHNTSLKSYSVRLDDFRVGIYTWKQNDKISGTGFKNLNIFRSNLNVSVRGKDIGGSIGIMNILFQGGIYLMMIYLISFSRFIYYSINYKNPKIFIIVCIFLVQLVLNPIQYRYILIYLLAFGLNYNPKYSVYKI